MGWKTAEEKRNNEVVALEKKETAEKDVVGGLQMSPLEEAAYNYLFKDIKVHLSTLAKDRLAAVFSKVLNNIANGVPRSKNIGIICQYLDVDQVIADQLLNMAFKLIEDDMKVEMQHSLNLARQRRLQVYNLAVNLADPRAALASLQDLSRLNNEYAQNKSGMDKLQQLIDALENVPVVENEDEIEIDDSEED